MIEQEGFKRLRANCISTGLCYECGACEVACPNGALRLRQYKFCRTPELVNNCVNGYCDRCYRACAARHVPLTAIESTFFGRNRRHVFPGRSGDYPNEHDEDKCGIVRNVYMGYALDEKIHGQAVSGGVSTALLTYALESGMIDGAIVAGFDPDVPYEAKAVVATTPDEILACAGSKYQPHPQLLGLREAVARGLERIAITCTPCHALSLRKMMLDAEFDDIVGRVKLIIGNICGSHWGRHGTENLIRNWMKTDLKDVAALKYRARPFPGDFVVTLKNGEERRKSFVAGSGSGLSQLAKFTPEECRYCLEKAASVTDIVVGDIWHHPVLTPKLLDTYTDEEVAADERIACARKGLTAVVIRSEAGQRFLDAAREGGAIRLFEETEPVWREFLCGVHDYGKPISNGPVIDARIVRGQPVREYF
ncbi:MAG: hypothetical protein GX174_03785 [Lentisphaerae bacterium]|jgi:coenzyme F420 hydrogenase subunit beta|nr:hypothetical protein [Lentisphaerota bacterium]